MKRIGKILSLALALPAICLIPVSLISSRQIDNKAANPDAFGIRQLYPTKKGAKEWFLPADSIPGIHGEITFTGSSLYRRADGVYVGKSK